MSKNIEQTTAEAILQEAEEIEIAGKRYAVKPMTVATIIKVSALVSELPEIELDEDNIMQSTIAGAKDCERLGEVVATMILGAKSLRGTRQVKHKEVKPILWGLLKIKRTRLVNVEYNAAEELGREIAETLTPRELNTLTARLIGRMQVADFFAVSTFLNGINTIAKTKVENNATTLSGLS